MGSDGAKVLWRGSQHFAPGLRHQHIVLDPHAAPPWKIGARLNRDHHSGRQRYCCDLTRTLSIGAPSAEARRVYGAVLEAQLAAIAAVRPGIEASAVDAAARGVLEGHGLGAAFGHGTGHGLGLDVHEDPRLTRPRSGAAAVSLQPGMVFTIEPGAYLPGWGGVRIEDDVLVTESGCEVLTSTPKELRAIGTH